MPRGGARSGSGRKAGTANAKSREIANRSAEAGLTPLEYLLSVMRDESGEEAKRIDAAKAAAPYIHPRLSNMDMNAKVDAKSVIQVVSGVPRD
jgi:hypothetical protein